MEDILFWILIALAALLAIVLLPMIVFLAVRLSAATAWRLREMLSSGVRDISQERTASRLRREMQDRVRKHMSAHGIRRFWRGGQDDEEMYAATVLLKDTVGTCCEIHHFTADVLGVTHMRELENHLVCNAHRTRVLDTLEFVLNSAAERDLVSKTQAKVAIGVEAMYGVCADCMLLKFHRKDAPRLCDPAKFIGCEADGERTQVTNETKKAGSTG